VRREVREKKGGRERERERERGGRVEKKGERYNYL
jgi:hypothetical protein